MTDSIASAVITRWNMENGELEDRATVDVPGRLIPSGSAAIADHDDFASHNLRFKLNTASQPNLGPAPITGVPHERIEASPQTSGDEPYKPSDSLRSQSWNPRSQILDTAGDAFHERLPGPDTASSLQRPASGKAFRAAVSSSGRPSPARIDENVALGETLDRTEVAEDWEDEGPRPSNPAERDNHHPVDSSPTASVASALSQVNTENAAESTAVHFALPSQPVDSDALLVSAKTPRHLIGNLHDKNNAGIGPGIYRLRSNFPATAAAAVGTSPMSSSILVSPSPRMPLNPQGLKDFVPPDSVPGRKHSHPQAGSMATPSTAMASVPQTQPQPQPTASNNQQQVGRKERRGSVYHQVISLFQPFAPRRLLKRLQQVATDAATSVLTSPVAPKPPPVAAPEEARTAGTGITREGGASRSMRVSIDQSILQRAMASGKPTDALAAQIGNRGGPAGPSNAPSPASTPTVLGTSGQLEPESEMVNGAMLIIDVSGFTALTEKLSQDEGRMLSGEHLIACLNDYFHRLYGIIEENGGDVIKFAGDAMIVLFDAQGSTEEKLTEASSRAVTAAYRAVSELGEVRMLPTGKVKPVVERVAISAPLVVRADSIHRGSKPVQPGGSVHGNSAFSPPYDHNGGGPRISKPEDALTQAELNSLNPTSAPQPMRAVIGARRPGGHRNSVEAMVPGWTKTGGAQSGANGIINAVLTGGGNTVRNALAGPVAPEVSIRDDAASRAHSATGDRSAAASRANSESERKRPSFADGLIKNVGAKAEAEASTSSSSGGLMKRAMTGGAAKKSVGIIDKPTQVTTYVAGRVSELSDTNVTDRGPSGLDVGLPYAQSSPPKSDSSKGDYSQTGELDDSIDIDLRRGKAGRSRSVASSGFSRFFAGLSTFMGRIFTSFSSTRGAPMQVASNRYAASATNMQTTTPKARNAMKSHISEPRDRESDSAHMPARPSMHKDLATVSIGRKSQPSFGAGDTTAPQPITGVGARASNAHPRHTAGAGPSTLQANSQNDNLNRQATNMVDGIPMDAEEFRLSIKVMCAVGKLYTYHVGYGDTVDASTGQKTTGRWEFFIGDGPLHLEERPDIRPPMQQLIDVETFAEKKKVVISQEVNTLLADYLDTIVQGEGKAYLLGDDVDLDILPRGPVVSLLENKIPALPGAIATSHYLESIKAHVPRCVSASIRDGHREFASEVRYCSCAFFGFPGLLDGCSSSSEAVQRIQKAFENVDKAMNIYEGEFLQFRCDEKGFLAVCCFGLMGKTHRDDAMRALHSALSVTNRMEKVGLKACCGVTTGILLCAFVGSTDRCEYTIFGDAINTSARLMVKSKARTGNFDILCDEVTQRLCMGQARFEEVQGIKLKGKAEGTKVFGVETLLKSNKGGDDGGNGPSDGVRREVAVFVGRENIVEQVMSTISDVIHGNSLSDVIIVSGEVGLGKSRLLQHSLEETRNRFGEQAICGAIQAEATGGGHVLAPWKRLMRSFVRQMEGKGDVYDDDFDPAEEDGDGVPVFKVEDMTQSLQHQTSQPPAAPSSKNGSEVRVDKPYSSFMSRSVAYGISEERPYDTGDQLHSSNEAGAAEAAALLGNGPTRVTRAAESGPLHPLAPTTSLTASGPINRLSIESNLPKAAARPRHKSGILASRTVSQKLFAGSPTPRDGRESADLHASTRAAGSVSRSQSLSKMALFSSLSKKSLIAGADGRSSLKSAASFHFSSRDKPLPDAADPSDTDFMTRTLQKMHVDRKEFYQWLNAKGTGNSDGAAPFSVSTVVQPPAPAATGWTGVSSPMPSSSAGPKNRKASVTLAQQLVDKKAGLFSSDTFIPAGSKDLRSNPGIPSNLRVEVPPASPLHLAVSAAFGAAEPQTPQQQTPQQQLQPQPPGGGPPTRIRRNSLLAKQEVVRQLSRSNLQPIQARETPLGGAGGVAGPALSFTPKQQRRRSLTIVTPKAYDDRDDFRLVVNFIKELISIRGCVVITVDELDRLDSLSVELLNYLLDVIPTGLVAIASISSLALRDLPRHVNELFRAHSPTILEMGLMSKEETGRFIDAVLGIEKGTPVAGSLVAGDPTLHEYIYERTHGHPLHTEQLLLLIKQSLDQDVSMEDLNYMLNKSISIAAVILKRIDELRPGSQLTLKVASVLGNRIELSLLQKIHPLVMSEAALQAQLTQLVQMNFLVRDLQEGVYRFSSELVREVCYGLIPVVQRGSIHQSIAFALQEALDAQGVDVPSAAIAYHLVKSLTNLDETAQYRARQAIDQLEQAAFEALEQHSFQEALGFLNDMEGILNHPVLAAPSSMFTSQIMNESLDDMSFKRAIASLGIAEALLGLHSWTEAEEKLETALDLLNHAEVLEKPSFSIGRMFGKKKGGRNVRIAPELARRTGENDMDIEELQIVVKVLELYLDLRSLLHNELLMDFEGLATPEDDLELLRYEYKREMAKVKMVLKNLGTLLRREANSKKRPLPYDIKERVLLAVSCI